MKKILAKGFMRSFGGAHMELVQKDSAQGHFRYSGIAIEKIWLAVVIRSVASVQYPSHFLILCQFTLFVFVAISLVILCIGG